ncbi:hypothetical protein J2I47_01515 [Fibrella sp. HMF5335]|uniref:Uncharacterized protein n=1 Tax=Fibrella rubiginis TaxID=2817060 RepID=A0A939K4B3_9BACT|nr:hypothetical protein [Fibrella rubiginis]MBO0935215.1 hypothetical protein [Fibrella rubiginis]
MASESQIFVLLDHLEHKVYDLSILAAEQQQRIAQLESEVSRLQETNREQERQLRQPKKGAEAAAVMPKSKDFVNLVSSSLPDAVAREAVKHQLDEYIRDLDRCIAHLSTLS